MEQPILSIKGLEVQFHTLEGVVRAVNGISFDLQPGASLGIVGESGCGKSVSMLAAMKLIKEPPGKILSGSVLYKGNDLLKMEYHSIEAIRGKDIAMVFQDPMTSFNPVLTIGSQISEVLIVHLGMQPSQAKQRAVELLEMVKIPNASRRVNEYPHQFSGGMRQRAMIAMALACHPSIMIADEPTTALDVTIQAQIIELIKDLRTKEKMAVIWITHDLSVVAEIADRVIVMYAGFIVEEADIYTLYDQPQHPYTIALIQSIPRVDSRKSSKLVTIPGSPPNCVHLPPGCPFEPRCKFRCETCRRLIPPLVLVAPDHQVACWVDMITGRER